MIRAPLSTTSVLDETSDAVALAAAPWAAVLVLTSLPWRFLQVLFVDQLIELGGNAAHYGRALGSTANAATIAFIVSLIGRAIYARAINLAAASGRRPGTEAFRVPRAALATYLFTGSLVAVLFYATWFTIIGIPLTIMVSGLAIGTMPLNDRAGIVAPLKRIGRFAREAKTLTALTFVFLVALAVAMVNLLAAFGIGLWLVHGFGGIDISRWEALLDFGTRRFDLLLIAGGIIAVEPFWIAANVILVRKAGAEESGEELRLWFRELAGR
ncbi:MAG: hypothetical protein QOI24_1636 [Acidobacteriota bacterium]|nr:hypothetical protein [Acidobacteriota bacterium]